MKADEVVRVEVEIGDRPYIRSALTDVKYTKRLWNVGVNRTDAAYPVFGLCGHHGTEDSYLSHMRYYLSDRPGDFKPQEVADNTDIYFYFDAGSSMKPIRIRTDELIWALQKLGILSEES